jgi:hypothetical protein
MLCCPGATPLLSAGHVSPVEGICTYPRVQWEWGVRLGNPSAARRGADDQIANFSQLRHYIRFLAYAS